MLLLCLTRFLLIHSILHKHKQEEGQEDEEGEVTVVIVVVGGEKLVFELGSEGSKDLAYEVLLQYKLNLT